MSSWKHSLFLLLVWVAASAGMAAQSYPVASITFSGAPAFSPAELLKASGLTVGASLDQPGMQAAAQRFDATGMFASIRFSFNGKELHFELTPASDLAPVRFANFPWFEARDILTQLTATVPLFHGQAAPDSGTQRKIIEALTAMLADRQITATIAATPDVDVATGKTRALVFRVTVPSVQVGEVTFTGATGDWVARLAEIGQAATGQEYSSLDTPATLTQAVETVYREKGYLEVRVRDVTHQPPVAETAAVKVPMTVTLVEGGLYRLGQFTVAGSVLMDQAEFASKALLKPGDPVEGEKLRRSLQTISAPYVTRGYLRAKITATPALNPEKHTVDYAIAVTPGEVYTMGKLEVKDLSPDLQALVLKEWKLNAGAPYDASYVQQFLKKNAKDLHPLDGYSAGYKQYEHEDTHVVDLVVSFRKGGPLS
jgi:outer membrane protein insertion porin family